MPTRQSQWSAKCPGCEHPHHYLSIHFPHGINDLGHWVVKCSNAECPERFVINLENPRDSDRLGLSVVERADEPYAGRLRTATDVVRHNVELSKFSHTFDYSSPPLFRCPITKSNLELIARDQLARMENDIVGEISVAEQFLLSRAPASLTRCLIKMEVPCACGSTHTATFYNRMRFGGDVKGDSEQDLTTRTLLADITGCGLDDRLDGILSKNEVMGCLEKLLIRWDLYCSRIILISPFVGHQWMNAASKNEIWEWLQRTLNPAKAMLITRPMALTSWKKGITDQGVDFKLLQSFGLVNKVLEATTTKQDFHAKVYAGWGPNRCEVFSGSANLLPGSSVENMSFRSISSGDFLGRYVDRLGIAWPEIETEQQHCILVERTDGRWKAIPDYFPIPSEPL